MASSYSSPYSSPRYKCHRILFLCIAGVLALFTLTSCRTDASIAIQPGGSIKADVDLSVDSAIAGIAGFSCSQLGMMEQLSGTSMSNDPMTLQIDDQSTDTEIHCIAHLDTVESRVGTSVLSETESSYILSIPRGQLNDANIRTINMIDPQFTLSIAMPGNIISAPGAAINGNTATFTEINVLVDGFNVEGEKTPTTSADSDAATNSDGTAVTTVTPAVTDTAQPHLSLVTWALIGIGVLLILTLGIGIARRRHRRKTYETYTDSESGSDSFESLL